MINFLNVSSFLPRATSCMALLILLSQTGWSLQPKNATTSARVAKKSTATPPEASPKVVDLKKKVTFSLTLGPENKPSVEFAGLDKPNKRIATDDPTLIEKLLKEEFTEPNVADGVVIRAAKNVKYKMVETLFKSIRAAMDKNKIEKPVYISVDSPKQQDDPDAVRTQEFICKNKKASELYDRVSNVARAFKVSVRLDPARNSITAKGPSSKVKAISNLINYLDKPVSANAGGSTAPPRSTPRNTTPRNTTPRNTTPNNTSPKTPDPNRSSNASPNKSTPDNDDARVNTNNNKSPGIQPGNSSNPPTENETTKPKPSSASGRYQLTGVGNSLFLLDTATGDCWFLDPSRPEMRWIKMPHPNDNR